MFGQKRELIFSQLLGIITDYNISVGMTHELRSKIQEFWSVVMPDHPYAQTAFLVPSLLQHILPKASKNLRFKAEAFGVIYQMIQAYTIFVDDVVDDSETRYSAPTFNSLHRHEPTQIYHGLLLESSARFLVNKLCKNDHKMKSDIYELINEALFNVYAGNLLQSTRRVQANNIELRHYTQSTLQKIAVLKMAKIHFYLPVAIAMRLAGCTKQKHGKLYSKVEVICGKIGALCQATDDYLDSFTNKKTDDIDGDIKNGEFTWLFLQAVEHCSPEDLNIFIMNYGRDDDRSVGIVKAILHKIDINNLFVTMQKEECVTIRKMIEKSFVKDRGIGQGLTFLLDWLVKIFKF